MWLLTTHRRPERLLTMLRSIKQHGCSTPGIVLVNGGEQPHDAYKQLVEFLPKNWCMLFDTEDRPHGYATQHLFEQNPGKAWYGVIADDGTVETDAWDTKLVAAAMERGMASANDKYKAPHRIGCCHVIRGDIVAALGWIVPPGFKHMYIDDVWETIGNELGIWACLMDVVVEHHHYHNNKAPMDDSYKNSNKYMHDDHMQFQRWTAQREADYNKLSNIVAARSIDVDFRGQKVVVCTPTISGRLELAYLHGLMEIQITALHHGVRFEYYTATGNSSITDVRNRLVKMFLDSDADWLMFIDDDIGFRGDSILRLMAFNKDIIAGAAPKRGWPLTFCCHFTKDQLQQAAQGTIPVLNVGTGFMLIKRSAMLAFIKHYCDGDEDAGWYNDQNHHDLFPNVFREAIKKRRRTSEDYTFCEMARTLGLTVFIDPTIKLAHVGKHTWEASVVEGLQSTANSGTKAVENETHGNNA